MVTQAPAHNWVVDVLCDVVEALVGGGGARVSVTRHLGRELSSDFTSYAEVGARGSLHLHAICAGPSGGPRAALGPQQLRSATLNALAREFTAGTSSVTWVPVRRALSKTTLATVCLVDSGAWSGTGGRRLFLATIAPEGPSVEQRRTLAAAARLLPAIETLLEHWQGLRTEREGTSAATFTQREQQILGLLAQGLSASAMAARVGLSPRTVHRHLGNIYRKLNAHDRLTAVNLAFASGALGRKGTRGAPPTGDLSSPPSITELMGLGRSTQPEP
jgi:DNA-binding CsgD family transcriptional regulator